MFCQECGNEISEKATICMKCGVPTNAHNQPDNPYKTRWVFILLGFFLGGLGIHNFYAGYTGKGITQLMITLFLSWWLIIPIFIIGIWVLIEICTVDKDANGNIMV